MCVCVFREREILGWTSSRWSHSLAIFSCCGSVSIFYCSLFRSHASRNIKRVKFKKNADAHIKSSPKEQHRSPCLLEKTWPNCPQQQCEWAHEQYLTPTLSSISSDITHKRTHTHIIRHASTYRTKYFNWQVDSS